MNPLKLFKVYSRLNLLTVPQNSADGAMDVSNRHRKPINSCLASESPRVLRCSEAFPARKKLFVRWKWAGFI
jgi:hypothetical protein